MAERLPLVVVTGFLGSGKTTLVRRFLDGGGADGTGVIVNEFGEAGLDHKLFVHAADQVELVGGGCLCCARRADVARALHDLVIQSRRAGSGFARAVIETSGLADPSPIIATLANDPWLRNHVELVGIVAVVDAVAGLRNLEAYEEARRQVAIADTVVVSKGDLRGAVPIADIARAVLAIAPDASILDAQDADFRPSGLMTTRIRERRAVSRPTFIAEAVAHREAVGSFVLALPGPVDWPAMTVWLSALLHVHGTRILRVKGLIRTTASQDVLVIHGVQHTMHPPSHLRLADADDTGSFLVFITDRLGKVEVERSLTAFLALAADAVPTIHTRGPPLVDVRALEVGA